MTAPSMGDVLHERDAELAQLRRAVERALAGHGGVVLVEGSAGIGKTRLLDEACRMADGRARVLRARGGEHEREIPLLVTRELFTPYVATAPSDELDRVFAGAAELAGPLLGRGSAPTGTTDPGFALTHGLYWLIADLADERPLLLVVDDVHWADESTQRWLAYVMPRVADHSALLLMGMRPKALSPTAPIGRGLAESRDVTVVRPSPLSREASCEVVRSELPDAVDGFVAAAHRATGGNPLLLCTLVSAVREGGVVPDAHNAVRLDELGVVELGRIVVPRLHALGPQAVALVRAVVVLGDRCDLADAADLADLSLETAAACFDRLVRAEMLEPGPGLSFIHPLVRSAVTDDLAPGARTALHRRAARLLAERGADAEIAARHLGPGGRVGEEWAVDVLQRAAAAAIERGVPEAAVGHLVLLLREGLPRPLRRQVLVSAAWQAHRAGDRRDRAWLEQAITLADDSSSWITTWFPLVTAASRRLDRDLPPDLWLGTAPDVLDDQALYAVRGYALFDFGITGLDLLALVEERFPARLPEPAGATLAEKTWLTGSSAREVMSLGDSRRAVEHARRAWHEGMSLVETIEMGGTGYALTTLAFTGSLDEVRAWSARALSQATRLGSRAGVEVWVPAQVMFDLLAGEVAAAEAHLAAMPYDPSAYTLRLYAIVATIGEIEVRLGRGRLAEAESFAERFATGDTGTNHFSAYLALTHGRVHLAAGHVDRALDAFRGCGEIASAFGGRSSPWYQWRGGVALCEVRRGNGAVARDLAEEQYQEFRRWGQVHAYGPALRTLGVVVGGEEGLRMLAEAAEELGPSPYRGEHREACLELGRALRRAGRVTEARKMLADVLEQADRAGATYQANQAEAELKLAGARPRRRAVTGLHALTPAELRVATLATEGLSNPEIAQSLFVTRKTVEKHLGSAFAKLHISSRDQLSAVLEATT